MTETHPRTIRLGSREVYGVLRWYIMDEAQRAAYHKLTGKATVQQGDIACLQDLGAEIIVTDEAYRPEHIEETAGGCVSRNRQGLRHPLSQGVQE